MKQLDVGFKMSQITSETFTADFVGTEDTKLEDMEALDLVTDLASLANLLSPATEISWLESVSQSVNTQSYHQSPWPRPQWAA